MTERISEAEHAVMEILWEEHPLSAQIIIGRTPPERNWSVTTVKTLLARLVSKGVIAATNEGRRYLYRPLVERDHYVNTETARLVDRLFKGRLTPFVAHFAERNQLTDEDINAIDDLLKALRK